MYYIGGRVLDHVVSGLTEVRAVQFGGRENDCIAKSRAVISLSNVHIIHSIVKMLPKVGLELF